MAVEGLRRSGAGLAILLTVLGASEPARSRPADAPGTVTSAFDDLAGWWIAVDDWWPRIAEGAGIPFVEELFIVQPDGEVENRVMQFLTPDAESCAEFAGKFCSDAPLLASARLAVSGNRLRIDDRTSGNDLIFYQDRALNARYLKLGVTGVQAWTYTLQPGGRVLALRADGADITRTFVRVDPDRLRRLRAGLIVANIGAYDHWRCFLANATAGDPAFGEVLSGQNAVPDFLDDYLRAASYGVALLDASSQAVHDDPTAARRDLGDMRTERLMVEDFADIALPTTAAERNLLQQRLEAFSARMRGEPTSVSLPLSDAEVAAVVRVATHDEEVTRLFCLDRN